MKRTLSVLLLAGTALAAMSAHAAPVFMLQFGSFESREEADEKLKALRTKHAGVLSRMEAGVREVTLPPDNLTVYRTQAGPLATRGDAQSVCSQLASNGDECYVVETAMMQPPAPPARQVAAAAPAPTPAPVPEPVTAAVAAPEPAVPVMHAAAAPSVVSPQPMPSSRDPKNIAAMNRLAGVAPAAVAPMDASTQTATDSMHRELADAAAGQAQPSAFTPGAMGVPPAVAAKKDRSLWDRIFGSDEDEAPAKVPIEPMPVAAPVERIDSAPVEALMPPVITTAAAPAAADIPLAPPPSPVLAPVQQTAPQPQPVPVPAAPVVTEAAPFRLPPPPAPTSGMSRPDPILTAPTTAQVPAPMAVSQQTNMPAPVLAAPAVTGSVPFQPAADPHSQVQVEEAKRVPLTQAQAAASPSFPPPLPASTAAAPTMPAALSPSATMGQKTLWAQVGPFADQQAALAYWDRYRRANPDFPVVRVRVTSPLMAQQRGIAQVNLRVGPFAREGFIQNLCKGMVKDGLQCGSITDMGVASGGNAPQRGLLPQARYR